MTLPNRSYKVDVAGRRRYCCNEHKLWSTADELPPAITSDNEPSEDICDNAKQNHKYHEDPSVPEVSEDMLPRMLYFL